MVELRFKRKPYPHQVEILEATKDKEYHAYFLEMGLGKSAMALVQGLYLYDCGHVKQMLVITKNGVDEQFIDEAVRDHLALEPDQYFAECWHSTSVWRKYNKFKGTLDNRFVILAINCEAVGTKKGLAAIRAFAQDKPTLLIVDESQEFAGLTATRTKNLANIASMFPYRRLMSGTPSGGNPLHYLPQMDILSPRIFGCDKWGFEYRYCIKEKQSTWTKAKDPQTGEVLRDPNTGKIITRQKFFDVVTGYKNLDPLQEIIAKHSSRKLKKDCLDLPAKIHTKVTFHLSDEERKLYNKVKTSILSELAPGKYVSAELAITKLIRLQQIACGFAVFEDLVTGERGKTLLPEPSRMKALLEKCEQVTGKTLIWSRFTTSTDQIIEKLKEIYGPESAVRYDGTVSPAQKQLNKIRFKKEPEVRWFVGNTQAGGVGLDLPEAENAFYYSNDYRLMTRLQSEDRNHRIGTELPVTYVDFVAANTVDGDILKALMSHFDIASKLTGDGLRQWLQTN